MARVQKVTQPAKNSLKPVPAEIAAAFGVPLSSLRKVGAAGKQATGSGKPKADPVKAVQAKAQAKAKPVKSETIPLGVRKQATADRKEQERETRAKARVKAEAQWEQGITREVPCACGCSEMVEIRRFKPGHDAKLFSRILNGEAMPAAAVLSFTR